MDNALFEKLSDVILFVWKMLNTNIISSLMGALVFGLIANYLFSRFEEKRISKEVITKLIDLMIEEIDKNIGVSKFLHSLKQNQCHTVPTPFHMVSLEFALQNPFFHRLSPDTGTKIISVIEDLKAINLIHINFHQLIFGPSAALSNTPQLKIHLFNAINTAMPNAQKELESLKDKLKRDRGLV